MSETRTLLKNGTYSGSKTLMVGDAHHQWLCCSKLCCRTESAVSAQIFFQAEHVQWLWESVSQTWFPRLTISLTGMMWTFSEWTDWCSMQMDWLMLQTKNLIVDTNAQMFQRMQIRRRSGDSANPTTQFPCMTFILQSILAWAFASMVLFTSRRGNIHVWTWGPILTSRLLDRRPAPRKARVTASPSLAPEKHSRWVTCLSRRSPGMVINLSFTPDPSNKRAPSLSTRALTPRPCHNAIFL